MDRDYEIKPVKTQKNQVTHPALAEAGVIPELMTSNIIVGKSGSGKTVLLHNLMTRKDFYADAFDRIILISPTGETDDIQKALDWFSPIWSKLSKYWRRSKRCRRKPSRRRA